jgi:hypothetical protein
MTTTTATKRKPAKVAVEGVHRTAGHLYYFNGNGPWPGVTTVTGVLDAPALTNWKLEQVALAALENAERLVEDRENGRSEAAVKYLVTGNTTARDRGSRIHQTLEFVLRRATDIPIDDRDRAVVNGARAWLNEHRVTPLAIEAFLINETLGYGGTCDLIAQIDGVTWLLDWKTGKSVAAPDGRVYSDMRLQLAAYAHAEFQAKPADSTRHPLPAIERYGILHVTEGGTRLYEADVTELDWSAFRACLFLHSTWKRGRA